MASPGMALVSRIVPGAAQLDGVAADAVVRVDASEHARRRAIGITGYTNLCLLGALLTLPAHERVLLADLSERYRRILDRAGPGVVDFEDGYVVRRLVPAAAVPLVLVRRHDWKTALTSAATFSRLLPSAVLLDSEPPDWPARSWEADLAGVGVLVRRRDQFETLLEPQSGQPPMTTRPARWRVLESAYLRWLREPTPRSTGAGGLAGHRAPRGNGAPRLLGVPH